MQNQTMAKRKASAIISTTVAVCCYLQLLCKIPTAMAGATSQTGARRTLYYQDTGCRLETFREFAYEVMSIDSDGSESQVGFGECYARGSTGAITTCDPTDGTSTVETYLDTACQIHLYSSKDSPECVDLRVDGETCPPGGPGSMASDCISEDPIDTITPGTFNLIGSPYSDPFCEERTGGDHIVSGNAFGIGNGECSLSPLVRGPRYALTECDTETNLVLAQVFSPEDSTCSGDTRLEMIMFARAVDNDTNGGMCALGHFEDGHEEYYRVKACTTEEETEKNPDIGPTPAPTPSIDSDSDDSHNAAAPVDYRGDGDDEDLRDDSNDSSSDDCDDDSSSSGGGGGGGGAGGGTSSSGHGNGDGRDTTSSSGENGDANQRDDDDITGSSSDDTDKHSDSNDATPAGGDSDNDSDSSDDGMSDDTAYAIAFGVSVAIVTTCLSGLLALAGSGGSETSKVGPKVDG
ncbi:unnamed protein product [Ectocarpus sp. CCAP 1310/34]|nr:unnamed protein product [Ectocarpus sp. CCAP 1310/34]